LREQRTDRLPGTARHANGTREDVMTELPLYPLHFEPAYQQRPWGARRLASRLDADRPGEGPIGDAWLLSDRDDYPSRVANGPLKGHSIAQPMERSPSFIPVPGQGVFVEAGTVHSPGDGVVFEVQKKRDVTFRHNDWDRTDQQSGKKRELNVERVLACIDYTRGAATPATPEAETIQPVERERLFDCRNLRLWRLQGEAPFTVGVADAPRIVVCIDGSGSVEYRGAEDVPMETGAVVICHFRTEPSVTLLIIAVPDTP
jgi:mannose-6-phosphate isomerase class I